MKYTMHLGRRTTCETFANHLAKSFSEYLRYLSGNPDRYSADALRTVECDLGYLLSSHLHADPTWDGPDYWVDDAHIWWASVDRAEGVLRGRGCACWGLAATVSNDRSDVLEVEIRLVGSEADRHVEYVLQFWAEGAYRRYTETESRFALVGAGDAPAPDLDPPDGEPLSCLEIRAIRRAGPAGRRVLVRLASAAAPETCERILVGIGEMYSPYDEEHQIVRECLSHPNPGVRVAAALAFTEIDDDHEAVRRAVLDTVAAAVEVLDRDPGDDRAYAAAVERAEQILAQAALYDGTLAARLVGLLDGAGKSLRTGIIAALNRMGDAAIPALGALRASARNLDRAERISVVGLLARFGRLSERSVESFLSSPDTRLRRVVLFSLEEAGPKAAGVAAPVMRLVSDDRADPVDRAVALRVLADVEPTPAVAECIDVALARIDAELRDPNGSGLRQTLPTLERLGPRMSRLVPTLLALSVAVAREGRIRLLDSIVATLRTVDERSSACARTIETVRAVLCCGYRDAQECAVLETMRPLAVRAIEEIHEAWRGSERSRGRCLRAVRDRFLADAAVEIRRFLATSNVSEMIHVYRTIERFGAVALPMLVEHLASERPANGTSAIKAVRGLGHAATSAIPALVGAMASSRVDVCTAAAAALSSIGPAAVPALTDQLDGEDPFVIALAAKALGRIGADAHQAVPRLGDLAHSEVREIRLLAVEALGRIGPASDLAVRDLTDLLYEPDPTMQLFAKRALDAIHDRPS